MDAIYTAPLGRRRLTAHAVRLALGAAASFAVEVLKDGIRGDDIERSLGNPPGAQFAALPDSSKQRLLDRGYRP